MSATPLPLPLASAPLATTIRVKELVEKVRAGAIRVPAFQRPLRWKGKDVVALLDSLWRGYPIGSLLFWKRSAAAETIRIGGNHLLMPAFADAWWLVDGQQRTTALAATLLDLDHAGDERWVACFDSRTKTFREGNPAPGEDGVVVPVSTLGDLRRLGRWIRESEPEDAAAEAIESAQQRLLDYSIPAYIMEGDDERVLREVFARLNSSGARMRADEIFQALHGGSATSEDSHFDLDDLAANCDLDGFGQPSRADVLKVILAIAGHDPNRTLNTSIDALAGLPPASEVKEAMARAREFLQNECKIPWLGLLPYPVAFVLLSRWFFLFPETSHEEASSVRTRLRHWLWRSALSGAHQRAEVTKMREQVRDLVADDLEGSLDRLLARVAEVHDMPWQLGKFHHANARSRIEMLALLAQRPCDDLGTIFIQNLLAEDYGRVAREIFATPDLRGLDETTQAVARTAANRVILGGMHTGLKSVLREWTDNPALLAGHLIDPRMAQELADGDIKSFLVKRESRVRTAVAAFLHTNAGFDEPVVRPVHVYLEADEASGPEEVQ